MERERIRDRGRCVRVREREATTFRNIYGFAMVFVQQILFVFTFFFLLFFFFFDLYNSTCIMWICSHSGFSNKPRVEQQMEKKMHTQIDIEEERKKRSQFEEQTKKKKTNSEWTHTDASRNKNVNDFLPLLFLISAFHQSFCIWKGKKKRREYGTMLCAHFMRIRLHVWMASKI